MPTASGKHQDPEKNLHENQSLLVAEPLVATLPRPGRAWRPGEQTVNGEAQGFQVYLQNVANVLTQV